MAIFHLSVKVISRASGRSAVAASAYRAAERLHDERLDRDHDFTNKDGVVHPAMQVTPDSFGRRIEAAADAARRGDQTRINDAYNELRQATQEMRGVTAHARTRADQRRTVFQAVGGGMLGGILLWSFLPGTIARSVPESWHWPERMAARMVGESSRWDAGTRLMRTESPQALNALERAADLLRDNRDAIEACQKSAANAKQPVRCTVRIRAGSESRN